MEIHLNELDKNAQEGAHQEHKKRPVIGITIGDFNGIGAEVIIKSLKDARVTRLCTPVIYGSSKIIARYKKLLSLDLSYHQVSAQNDFTIAERKVNIINCWEENFNVEPGRITQEAGRCAWLAIKASTEDLKNGKIDAVVTAPINKYNIQSEDFKFPGHTEYYTQMAGVHESLMLLTDQELRVGVVTGHIPVSKISEHLTFEKVNRKVEIFLTTLKNDFGIIKPKVAILGLNPHAGENGLLGEEEQKVINPVVLRQKALGNLVYGAFPSDGFFGMGQYRKFDGVLAMYHDQGLIPFKTLAFETGVNYTAGLPLIRTSPDHGTAYDIAGQGIANHQAMLSAIFTACDVVKNRTERKTERETKELRKEKRDKAIREFEESSGKENEE